MSWVRIDDKFYNHPKVLRVGPLGIALQVTALCYCNAHLTDGLLPREAVPGLLNFAGIDGPGRPIECWDVVDLLLGAGMWSETKTGYVVHDYLEYQPDRASVTRDREAARVRQARFRETSDAKRNAVTNARVTGAPIPIPTPKKEHRESAAPRRLSPRPPSEYPSAKAFREVVNRWPAKSLQDGIHALVGSEPDAVELWRKIVRAWIGLGWNPMNTDGMLEFFKRQEIPRGGKPGDNGKPAKMSDKEYGERLRAGTLPVEPEPFIPPSMRA